MGKFSTPKEMKRARRLVCVGAEGNRFYKVSNRRRRRRQEKEAVRKGDFEFQAPGLAAWDVY